VFKVAETLKPGEPFSVIYKDPSGKTLLDVPAAPGVEKGWGASGQGPWPFLLEPGLIHLPRQVPAGEGE
jgi:hypothetical protein